MNVATIHWRGLALALVLTLLALALTTLFRPLLAQSHFLLFMLAVVISTVYGGLAAGLFACLLAATLTAFLLMQPNPSLEVANLSELIELGVFVAVALLINSLIVTRNRAEQDVRESHAQLETILQRITDGVTVQSAEGTFIYANETAARLLGFSSAAELLRTPVQTIRQKFELRNEFGDTLPMADWPGRRALRGEHVPSQLLRFHVRATGDERWSQIGATPIYDAQGNLRSTINVFHDVTDQKRTERRLRAQYTTAQILAQATTIADAMPPLFSTICESLGWEVGLLWLVERESGVLRCHTFWERADQKHPTFAQLSQSLRLTRGQGLPGRVWHTAETIWLADATQDSDFLRAREASRERLHAAFGFPIRIENEVIGVIEFFSQEIREPDADLLALMTTIGTQLGQFIERKQREAELAEAERKYRTLVEQIPAITYRAALDDSGSPLYISPQLESILGYSTAEWMSEPDFWIQRIHPDDRARVLEANARMLQTGEPFHCEYRQIARDGRIIWMQDDSIIVRDEASHSLYLQGVVFDITARKESEQAQREAEVRYRTLVEQIPAIIYVSSLQEPRGLLYLSPQHETIMGYSCAEWMNDSSLRRSRIHPEDRERLFDAHEQSLASGMPFRCEYRLFARDGREVWMHDEAMIIRDEQGQPRYMQGVVFDITARKRAEETLRLSEQRFRAIWETANDAMALSDSTGIVLMANPAYFRLYGYSAEEVIGKPFNIIFPPEQRSSALERYHEVFNSETLLPPYESSVQRADGARRIVESHYDFIMEHGQRTAMVSLVRDITDRSQAAAALRALADERDRALSESKLLNDLASATAGEQNLSRILTTAMIQLRSVIRFSGASIARIEGDEMYVRAAFGSYADVRLGRSIPHDAEHNWGVYHSREPLLINDLEAEGDNRLAAPLRSWLGVPLIWRGQTYGVLELYASERDAFAPADLSLMQKVATILSGSIELAERYAAEVHALALAESTQWKLETVLRQMPSGVAVIEYPSGQLMLGNEQFERLMGLNTRFGAALTPEHTVQLMRADGTPFTLDQLPLMRALRSGEVVKGEEVYFYRADGARGVMRINAAPIRDRRGNVIAAAAILDDISEQKQAEAELHRTNSILSAIFDGTTDAVFAKDLTGHYVLMNAAGAAMLGKTPAEVIGRNDVVLFSSESVAAIQAHDQQVIASGETITYEETSLAAGTRRTYLSTKGAYRDPNGNVIGVIGISRDITQRKRNEESQRFLAEASRILASSLDYESTLSAIAKLIVPDLAQGCVIDLVQNDGQLQPVALEHVEPIERQTIEQLMQFYPRELLSATAVSRAMQSGQPIVIPDLRLEMLERVARDAEHLRLLRELHLCSAMIVPLIANNQTLGALTLLSTSTEHRFGDADIPFAEAIASRAALAVVNARLYRAEQQARTDAERAAERISRLQTITAALSEALTPVRVADVVVPQGLAALNAIAGSLSMLSDDGQFIELVRVHGYLENVAEAWRQFPISLSTPISDAIRTGETVLIGSLDELRAHYPQLHANLKSRNQAFAAVPLVIEGRASGALGLSWEQPQQFSNEDRDFMLALARQCAQAMERARLHHESEELTRSLERRVLERTAELRAANEQLQREVTERLQAEQKIAHSEYILAQAQQVAHVGSWQWDTRTNVITWSDELHRIYGIGRDEPLTYERYLAAIHPEDRAAAQEIVATAYRERSSFSFDHRIVRADGQVRTLHARGEVIVDGHNEVTGMLGTGQDITERKQIEIELRQSREELRRLSGHLQTAREEERTRIAREIHDQLGQVLTAVKMDLTLLSRRFADDNVLAPAAIIQQEIGAMSKMIDDTIQSVRHIITELRPEMLEDLGLRASMEWQVQEFEARTQIRARFNSELLDVQLDMERSTAVFRILQEALTNVARHANAKHVHVNLRQAPAHLILEVRDDGRGITRGELVKAKSFGILGMRERAMLFGGEVEIDGSPGRGTTLVVKIPYQNEGAPLHLAL